MSDHLLATYILCVSAEQTKVSSHSQGMGFPGWELGWICYCKRSYSYLRIYQTIDHRPQVSQDTLRKAYVTQYVCHLSPGSGGHVT